MSIHYSPRIVTDGLVLYLDAANPKSYPGTGTVWKDLTRNGNDATLTDIVFSENDNALDYNGSTSQAVVSSFVPPRTEHTILIWCKSDVGLNNTTSSGTRKTLFKNMGSWAPGLWINGQIIRPHQPPQYRDKIIPYRTFTQWNLLGQIFDGSNVYTIDQDEVTLDTLVSGSYTQSTPTGITIGHESGTTSFTWNGKISSFLVYNRSLSEAEVKQHYNVLKSRYQ